MPVFCINQPTMLCLPVTASDGPGLATEAAGPGSDRSCLTLPRGHQHIAADHRMMPGSVVSLPETMPLIQPLMLSKLTLHIANLLPGAHTPIPTLQLVHPLLHRQSLRPAIPHDSPMSGEWFRGRRKSVQVEVHICAVTRASQYNVRIQATCCLACSHARSTHPSMEISLRSPPK